MNMSLILIETILIVIIFKELYKYGGLKRIGSFYAISLFCVGNYQIIRLLIRLNIVLMCSKFTDTIIIIFKLSWLLLIPGFATIIGHYKNRLNANNLQFTLRELNNFEISSNELIYLVVCCIVNVFCFYLLQILNLHC